MIIVYVHIVPPSEWLHQGLVSHSGEVSVVPCTQISTQCLQSHMGAPWIFYLSNQDLCHEFVCTIPTVRDGCLSLQPFVPAGGRSCCCSISQTDRETDRQTHWQALTGPTAAVGTKHPQLHQCCAAEFCLSLFLSLLSSNVGASCLQTTCHVSLGYNRLWLITQTLLSENM